MRMARFPEELVVVARLSQHGAKLAFLRPRIGHQTPRPFGTTRRPHAALEIFAELFHVVVGIMSVHVDVDDCLGWGLLHAADKNTE
jgi:hypothetical protein